MRHTKCWIVAVASLLALAPFCSAKNPSVVKAEKDRLQNSGKVMQEILNVPEEIPQDMLDKARCVVVMPSVLKAAFVFGGSYGRGTMVCRTGKNFTGRWGAPAMYALEGGSFGFQVGGEATDFVFLVINDRGAGSLLHSKVKLGADASFAAGPKGRSAAADSDAYMRAEILSYSRARGVFMRGGKNEIRKVAQLGRSSWDGSNTTITLMTGSSKKLKSPISSSLT